MVNDLNDTHHRKPKLALTSSKSSPITHVIDNPLDEFSNYDDQTNDITTPTGITLHHNRFIQNNQTNLIKWHASNYFQNENRIFIPKLIKKLNHFIHHKYELQLYLIIQLSIPLLKTNLLITILPIRIMTALSKYIPKQNVHFLHHLFRLHSFTSV